MKKVISDFWRTAEFSFQLDAYFYTELKENFIWHEKLLGVLFHPFTCNTWLCLFICYETQVNGNLVNLRMATDSDQRLHHSLDP